jgi:translation initiation factor 2 subunit 3
MCAAADFRSPHCDQGYWYGDVVVVLTKIECVGTQDSRRHDRQVKRSLRGTVANNASVISTSAQLNINADTILNKLADIEASIWGRASPPPMMIVHSFDVHRPGSGVSELKSGIASGTLTRGVLHLNNEIEIRPGPIIYDSVPNTSTGEQL